MKYIFLRTTRAAMIGLLSVVATTAGAQDFGRLVLGQDHLLVYMRSMNSEIVRPAMAMCLNDSVRSLGKITSELEMMAAKSESASEANKIRAQIGEVKSTFPINARVACIARGMVLMEEMFRLGSGEVQSQKDLDAIERVLRDRTNVGWQNFAKVFSLDSERSFNAAASRFAGEYSSAIGDATGEIGELRGKQKSETARLVEPDIAEINDQMKGVLVNRLRERAVAQTQPINQLLVSALMFDQLMRSDPGGVARLPMEEPLKSKFTNNVREISKLLGCNMVENAAGGQNPRPSIVCK